MLFPGYLIGYSYFTTHMDGRYASMLGFWKANPTALSALSLSVALLLSAAALVYYWSLDNWSGHPFVHKLMPYATNGLWRRVVGDINTEFRRWASIPTGILVFSSPSSYCRIDKFTIHTSPITKVVVTDNWVLLLGQWPWQFRLAHQSDVATSLEGSDHHHISTEGQLGGTQFLTVRVNNRRSQEESFVFRWRGSRWRMCEMRRELVNGFLFFVVVLG